MIMLSQDENTIVNFDNVENIQVRKLPANETGYAISVETFCSNFDRFAIYDTEERAKEVLRQLLCEYENCNCKSYSAGFGYVSNAVYEMPEK